MSHFTSLVAGVAGYGSVELMDSINQPDTLSQVLKIAVSIISLIPSLIHIHKTVKAAITNKPTDEKI